MEKEGHTSVRGTKAMWAKDRVTAFECKTRMVPSKFRFKSSESRKGLAAFVQVNPQIAFSVRKNAWSDAVIFREWFQDLFPPYNRRQTSRLVALGMHNRGAHGSDITDGTG